MTWVTILVSIEYGQHKKDATPVNLDGCRAIVLFKAKEFGCANMIANREGPK
jgi:hypothetical protein